MKKAILHIPHSSTNIPIKDGYVISTKELKAEILKLTDWYTDDLFNHKNAVRVIAPFSRIFCDVERFPNDEDEIMSKSGMGMTYTTLDDGRQLRKISKEQKNVIYEKFYKVHHDLLLQKTEDQLKKHGKCLIIDCHSFSNTPFARDLNKKTTRPDIDIGVDSFHTPKTLVNISTEFFKKMGISCKINVPYAGSIVPLKYYRKDNRVQSIMIEVNRNLYLKKESNIKNKNYDNIKRILNKFIEVISSVNAFSFD